MKIWHLNKTKDEYGVVHATSPSWVGSGVVGTLCAYGLPEDDVLQTEELVNCHRCKLALGFLHEAALELDKAISFGRREAGFLSRLDRRMGTPSDWAKLRYHDVREMHREAGDLFHHAIARDLPVETVIRCARRVEAIRLELDRCYD